MKLPTEAVRSREGLGITPLITYGSGALPLRKRCSPPTEAVQSPYGSGALPRGEKGSNWLITN